MKITAHDIQKLLAVRHREDVYIPECKNGPAGSTHIRMDGWAMRKSWASPLVTGYEIKVSRSDFVRDTKWHGYLPLCNCLYFVTPPGLMSPEEIPPECGLLVTTKTGSQLLTKKKAPYRDVVIPEAVFRYIIMCRSRIGTEYDLDRMDRVQSKREFWENWLKNAKWNDEVGHRVRRALSLEVWRIQEENKRLKEQQEEVALGLKTLRKLGIGSWEMCEEKIEEAIKARLETLKACDMDKVLLSVEFLIGNLQNFVARHNPRRQGEGS